MTQDDKSLNVLKNLKECFSQMLYLFPKALLFSCTIYLPVFISKGLDFFDKGEFVLYSGWAVFCNSYLYFVIFYLSGEFLALRKMQGKDLFSLSLAARFLKSFIAGIVLVVVMFLPLFIIMAALPKSFTTPGSIIFNVIYALLIGVIVSITTFVAASVIWKQFGVFRSYKYVMAITSGMRFKILGICFVNVLLLLPQMLFSAKVNPILVEKGIMFVFSKFVFDFVIYFTYHLFFSLFILKIFIRLEELSGCNYILRSDEFVRESVAKEEVAVYQNA